MVPSVVVPLIWVRGGICASIARLGLVTELRILLAPLLELLPTIRTTWRAVRAVCRCVMSLVTAMVLPRVGIRNIYRQVDLLDVGCLCYVCRQWPLSMHVMVDYFMLRTIVINVMQQVNYRIYRLMSSIQAMGFCFWVGWVSVYVVVVGLR